MKKLRILIFSLFVMFGIASVATTSVKANSYDYYATVKADSGTTRQITDSADLVITHSHPAVSTNRPAGTNASTKLTVYVPGEAYLKMLWGNNEVIQTQYIVNATVEFIEDAPTSDTKGHVFKVQINGVTFGYMATGEITSAVIEFQEPVDNMRPAFSGQENFIVNVDQPPAVSYFQSFLKLIDDVDGDITDQITIETDNYTPNKSKLGTHSIIFRGEDAAGNVALLEVFVRVYDITNPVITSPAGSTGSVGYKETFNITSITNQLVVTDNYDTGLTATLKTDNYTSNKTKLGTHNLIYEAADASGNKGTFTFKVTVIDNIKPTFSGPTVINKPNNSIMMERDIREQLTASDEIDGNVTSKITVKSDQYTGNGSKVGSYNITYEVKDNAGNTATHVVTVVVQDNLPPVFWIEDGVTIRISKDQTISREQIIDMLTATGQLNVTSTTTFSFPLDEYTGNENMPGIYAMSIRARNTNGEESVHSLAINVLDDEKNDDDITIEKGSFNWMLWVGLAAAAVAVGYYVKKRK